MLVYYGNIQCISARELIDGGYITESCYRNWVNRGRIKVVRRGGGAAGNCALVALNSLPISVPRISFHTFSRPLAFYEVVQWLQ